MSVFWRLAARFTLVLGLLSISACTTSSHQTQDGESLTRTSDSSSPLSTDASPTPQSDANTDGVMIQNLPDDNSYRFCSEPFTGSSDSEQPFSIEAENADSEQSTHPLDQSIRGLCFAFRKDGSQIIGTYYDTSTLGEEGLCISGVAVGNKVTGKGREFVGSVGRQSVPPGSAGSTPVNWSDEGFLTVADAVTINFSDSSGSEVYYNQAVLDLSTFHRYPNTEIANDCPDLSSENQS
ncbi:MAG: hypothetical protein ACFE0J_21335 [Elainellaceae cyanobacterium]